MKFFQALLRGFRGHPLHPALTDLTVGGYTVATIAVVLALAGVAEERFAGLAYLAVVVALISSVATVITGFADYLRIPRGTPLRRTGTLHWVVQVVAGGLFLVAAVLLKDGYDTGSVSTGAALVTIVAWATMTFGAWVGGAITYVYGMRVLNQLDTPTGEALKPHLPPD